MKVCHANDPARATAVLFGVKCKMDIKVLMQNRTDMLKTLGGDAIQFLKTRKYLEKLGLNVDISFELKPPLQEYDLVHLFHLLHTSYETYIRCLNAKRQKKPIVLTPIYWNQDEYLRAGLGFERKIFVKLHLLKTKLQNINFIILRSYAIN